MYAVQPEQPDEPLQMTEAEYLAFEAESEVKHEFNWGYVYAMTGGSVRHGVITASIIGHLISQIGDRNCSVTSSDVRVHIASKNAYRYPDVTVFCGDPAFIAGRTDTFTNPVVVVECCHPTPRSQIATKSWWSTPRLKRCTPICWSRKTKPALNATGGMKRGIDSTALSEA